MYNISRKGLVQLLLSPRIDVVFKMLFADADNLDLLADFIAAILDVEPSELTDIEILNGEVLPDSYKEKFSRLDLLLKVGGRKINIEMQIRITSDFTERVLFYAAKTFTKGLKSGHSYSELEQTISINILDYVMFDAPQCHSSFMLKELSRDEVLTDKLRIDFLELPKAKSDTGVQIKRLRKWMEFLNIKSEEDADMLVQNNDTMITKAVHSLRKMSDDEKKQEIARIRERALHDEASIIASAQAEGLEKGLAKGEQNGISKMIQMMRLSGMSDDAINNVLAQRSKLPTAA